MSNQDREKLLSSDITGKIDFANQFGNHPTVKDTPTLPNNPTVCIIKEIRNLRLSAHLLQGVAIAALNKYTVFEIVKEADDPERAKIVLQQIDWETDPLVRFLHGLPTASCMAKSATKAEFGYDGPDSVYKLSESQAEQILKVPLETLTKLHRNKIASDYKETMATIDELFKQLDNVQAEQV